MDDNGIPDAFGETDNYDKTDPHDSEEENFYDVDGKDCYDVEETFS